MRFLAIVFLLFCSVAQAQKVEKLSTDGIDQDEFRDIAKKLRCPTCKGLSVLESEAAFSVQIQNRVIEQLREGLGEEEIFAYFVDHYGPWILREPPKKGFSLIAWFFPIGLLVVGPLGVWVLVWRRKSSTVQYGVRSHEALVGEFQAALAEARKS